MAWEGQQAVREEQGSPTEKLTMEGGRNGGWRGAWVGAGGGGLGGGGLGKICAKLGGGHGRKCKGGQIHWKKRNFTVGPWGSSRGSHRGVCGGQAGWFGGSLGGEGFKRWGIGGIRIGTSDRFGRGRGEYHTVVLTRT